MINLHYTTITAAVLAIGLILLSVPVSLRRMKSHIMLGTGDDATLLKLVRAQGNFIEYAPLGVTLLALVECTGGARWCVLLVAGALLAGRLLHPIGLLTGSTPLRGLGMLLTFTSLLSASIDLIGSYLAAA
jgi:uncharacterized membrane protein YecN with MAPEG domain